MGTENGEKRPVQGLWGLNNIVYRKMGGNVKGRVEKFPLPFLLLKLIYDFHGRFFSVHPLSRQ